MHIFNHFYFGKLDELTRSQSHVWTKMKHLLTYSIYDCMQSGLIANRVSNLAHLL